MAKPVRGSRSDKLERERAMADFLTVPLGNPSVLRDSEEGRAFFQTRLALFGRLGFCIIRVFYPLSLIVRTQLFAARGQDITLNSLLVGPPLYQLGAAAIS